jgi:hypothetical protein
MTAQFIVGIIETRQLRVQGDGAPVPVAGKIVPKSGR